MPAEVWPVTRNVQFLVNINSMHSLKKAPEPVDEYGSDKVEQHCTYKQCHGREDDVRQPRSASADAWHWRDGTQVHCAAIQSHPTSTRQGKHGQHKAGNEERRSKPLHTIASHKHTYSPSWYGTK
jgi:hypothetical protein